MKKIVLLLILAITVVSCGGLSIWEDTNPDIKPGKTGKLTISALAKESLKSKTKTGDAIKIENFTIVILKEDKTEWRRWAKFSDVPTDLEIPVGNYTLQAFYGENKPAAFESPYYLGEKAFSINADQITTVETVATLANMKVTISYSEKLLTDLNEIQVVVKGQNDAILTYTPTETRAGYFMVPDSKEIGITVTGVRKSNNLPVTQTTKISNTEVSQWHKATVSLVSNSGNGNISLAIDNTLVEKDENIEIPEEDDITGGGTTDPGPEPGASPTVTGASYNGTPFNIDKTLTVAGASEATVIDVLIAAEAGIKNLFVTINSPSLPQDELEGMGLGGTFDMCNPSDETREVLTMLGLLDEMPITGKKNHTFSVGSLIAMLKGVGGVGQTHTFVLKVVDANGGSAEKSLTISLVE